ncbi:VRR-NUC domain-containing protein [Burkholderia guangdongensis]|uniref:VRR-NUC domain-containing protein n=1 Tax=Burkholderia guangdongensis TaxID=1792500 RepID=UPI0015CD4441|nr:VRR-NUC domain-containing protein [Burkholderia guangdongensis]
MSRDVPGGMSSDGTTTKVHLGGDLDPQDKKVLCAALCQCKKGPNISIVGARLKQACVATKLSALDAKGDSIYKPEVSYNMNEYPPAPIMSSRNPLEPHGFIPAWIKANYGEGYVPGVGWIRRPDVVIVKDPTQPPTQDNLASVVDMKFPPDKRNVEQMADYQEIAGPNATVAELDPASCGCPDDDNADESSSPTADALRDAFSSIGKQVRTLLNQTGAGPQPGAGLPPPVPFPVH